MLSNLIPIHASLLVVHFLLVYVCYRLLVEYTNRNLEASFSSSQHRSVVFNVLIFLLTKISVSFFRSHYHSLTLLGFFVNQI